MARSTRSGRGGRWALAGVASGGLLLACGAERVTPAGRALDAPAEAHAAAPRVANTPPQIEALVLDPREPLPGGNVTAHVEAVDPDGDPIRLHYVWEIAGDLAAERSDTLALGGIAKGTRIGVTVRASDGRAESEPLGLETVLGNHPPRVTAVRIEPHPTPLAPAELRAVVDVVDPEDDPIDAELVWLVRDRRVEGHPEFLAAERLARGDVIRLRVVASDGDTASEPLESAAFSIPNRPPEIARTPLEVAAGRGLHHTIEARDPDGDKQLRFALVEAPEGASIDPVLGELAWQPRPDQLGTHPIEVVVSDGHGGEANARWEITVAPTPPASPAPE